jgi:hypothetical protein
MTRALQVFDKKNESYAIEEIDYEQSLTISATVERLRELVKQEPNFIWTRKTYFIVAYYSRLRAGLDQSHYRALAELDERAFCEGMQSKALIKYWYGNPDSVGRNLATCKSIMLCISMIPRLCKIGVWTNRASAEALTKGEEHKKAMGGRHMYDRICLKRLELTIDPALKDWWTMRLLSQNTYGPSF